MFAPPGYIPVTRIVGRIASIAGEMVHAEAIARRTIPTSEFWRDVKAGREDLYNSKRLLEAWLLARTITSFDVYAASPNGHVLLVDGWALEHQEQLDWYEWDWPDKYTYDGELNTPMQILREGFNPLSRFLFIDFHTGTISISRRREWLYAEEARTGDKISAIASALEKLDDWAICFKSGDLPESEDELLRCIGADLPRFQPDEGERVNRRGRPQKVPQIAAAYISIYPDGHGRLQREDVRRAIEDHVKFGFSLDTLDRAIRSARQDFTD